LCPFEEGKIHVLRIFDPDSKLIFFHERTMENLLRYLTLNSSLENKFTQKELGSRKMFEKS
jgi:hypothetical protein